MSDRPPITTDRSAPRRRRTLWWLTGPLMVAIAAGLLFHHRHRRPGRHLQRARDLVHAGEFADASAWLDLPLNTPATRPQALLLQARAALGRGRPQAAIAPLDELAAEGPLAADVALGRGQTCQALGDFPTAIVWFRKARSHRPDDPEVLRGLAAASYELGDLPTVAEALKALLALRPQDAAAWRTLALVTLEAPDSGESAYSEARLAYEKCLQADPLLGAARIELAAVLLRLGDPDGAEGYLDRVPMPERNGDHAHHRAQAAWARGEREVTRERCDEGLARWPRHAGLLALRGTLDLVAGQAQTAVAWFDRAVAANPHDPAIRFQRAHALRVAGRDDEAQAETEAAAALKALVQDLSRWNAEAIARPRDPEPRLQAARLCERLGKKDLAATWYRAARALRAPPRPDD